MIAAGIDAGSRAVKVVLLDAETRTPVASAVGDQGVHQRDATAAVYDRALASASLARRDVARAVATGYARNLVDFADVAVTEITCHARGVHHVVPAARTVVEIGGQDSKLLHLDADGGLRGFEMNSRCAAGTGRFLEVVADRLDVPLGELGRLAARSGDPAAISSMCVVFAETEIIGLLAAGTGEADIVAGVLRAVAGRVAAMAGSNATPPVAFTGGVALVAGMDEALAAALDRPVRVAPGPQMTGALGAALIAAGQIGP